MFFPFVTVLPCNSNQPLIARVQPFREIKRANFRRLNAEPLQRSRSRKLTARNGSFHIKVPAAIACGRLVQPFASLCCRLLWLEQALVVGHDMPPSTLQQHVIHIR